MIYFQGVKINNQMMLINKDKFYDLFLLKSVQHYYYKDKEF